MQEELKKKLARIEELAMEDELYLHLKRELSPLEEKLNRQTETLSEEAQDVLWGFIMQSQEISRRKLEIACKHMDFRD